MNHFTNKFWFGLAFVAAVFLLLVGNLASGQTAVAERTPAVLTGFMNCGNAEDGSRVCPFGLHYVNLVRGHTYMIRMECTDFDASLVLEDEHGNVLATDVDNYDTLYGTVVFRPAETGRYRLVANAVTPTEGYYAIIVNEMPVVLSVEEELTPVANNRNERVFDVAMTVGRRYIIDMDSNHFDAVVKVLNAEGAIVSFEDECGVMRNARVVFEPTTTATYRIVAAGFDDRATGPFRLVVCED